MAEKMLVKLSEIEVRQDLYPREQYDEETVNAYRTNLGSLPPIIISENNILVDGYHRLIAYRIEQKDEILCEKLGITTDDDILQEAIRRNVTHGNQLSLEEKKGWARHFFDKLTGEVIADLLAVSTGTVSNWTKKLAQDKRDDEKAEIIDLWLRCKTQNEIANVMGVTRGRIAQIVNKFKNEKINDLTNNPPESLKVFNLWNFGKSKGLKYPGQIPSQVMENLLWYYTKPFDVIYDPMAGGGRMSTVCSDMSRRWQLSDIAPVVEDIRQHDITTGFPDWLIKPDFIFLDPPYWDMKQGDYSADDTNLANMPLKEYYDAISKIAKSAKSKLRKGGHIAWIVSATQKNGEYIDHAIKFFNIFSKLFTPVIRCDVPYTTQIANGATIESAKKAKLILKQTRDLGVFYK